MGKHRGAVKNDRSFTIPKDLKWTVDDFKDLYKTMRAFKKRFMARSSHHDSRAEESRAL
jgi:hypothetical protein